jgi:hypothetical protein
MTQQPKLLILLILAGCLAIPSPAPAGGVIPSGS